MRDRLIFGCTEDALSEKFYREKYENLTFDKAVEICQIYLSARRQLSTFHGSSMKEHESVQAVKSKPKPARQWLKSGAGQPSVRQNTKGSGQSGKKTDFCAKKHQWVKQHCPAYGKTCNRCGRKNHFAVKCQSSSTK